MLTGIDISGWNDPATVAKLPFPVQFAVVKATESSGWSDPRHTAHVAAQRAGRRLLGHYHFGYPETDPLAQARHFLAVAKPAPGEAVVLDWEKLTGTPAQRVTGALRWLAYVKAATGASPWFYSYQDYINTMRAAASPAQWAELTTYPLWIAAPTMPAGKPGDLHGWPVWTAHQFGWGAGNTVDRDVFNGGPAVWAALAVPHPAAPKPAPTPPARKPPAPTPPPVLTVTLPAGTLTHPITLTLK